MLAPAHFDFQWELQSSRDGALRTPLSHSAARQPSAARLNARQVFWSSPVCPLTLHLQVHYILRSNHQSALSLRRVRCFGGASSSLCGSACRQASRSTDHYRYEAPFPQQNYISGFDWVPGLFLFTLVFSASGHSNLGTALTRGKTQAQINILLCFVDEMEMLELMTRASGYFDNSAQSVQIMHVFLALFFFSFIVFLRGCAP